MRRFDKNTLEVSMQTIEDQLRVSQAVTRAARFNREATLEAHIAIVEARWQVLRSVVLAEMNRLEVAELAEHRTHGAESAVNDEEPLRG